MVFNYSCPISGEQRDHTTARGVAVFVFLLTTVALLIAMLGFSELGSTVAGFLALDFIIRAFLHPKYSPLATLARGGITALKLQTKMVDSGPKVFAARIGVIFTVGATILLITNFVLAAIIVLGILWICSLLESVFSFCVGCWVYSISPRKLAIIMSK